MNDQIGAFFTKKIIVKLCKSNLMRLVSLLVSYKAPLKRFIISKTNDFIGAILSEIQLKYVSI